MPDTAAPPVEEVQETENEVIGAPLFDDTVSATSAHDVSEPTVKPRVTELIVGVAGIDAAEADAVVEASEVPAADTAETRKSYEVPPVRPETVIEVAVDAGCEKIDHVEASTVLYSTR